ERTNVQIIVQVVLMARVNLLLRLGAGAREMQKAVPWHRSRQPATLICGLVVAEAFGLLVGFPSPPRVSFPILTIPCAKSGDDVAAYRRAMLTNISERSTF